MADRGTKPREKKEAGGHLLWNTKSPCVIVESFFLDSTRELHRQGGIKMKGVLINLGIRWIIGALRSSKEGIREKAIDGLKKIPDEELLKGINGIKN